MSSNNQHANIRQLTNLSADSITSVNAQDLGGILMTPTLMLHMKPHVTTMTTGKRLYTCTSCKKRGHTQSNCPDLLSGNQCVKPAKTLLPGRYLVYETTEISNKRINLYPACNLNRPPMELYPDSATSLSIVEHSLFESSVSLIIVQK